MPRYEENLHVWPMSNCMVAIVTRPHLRSSDLLALHLGDPSATQQRVPVTTAFDNVLAFERIEEAFVRRWLCHPLPQRIGVGVS